MKKHFTKIVLVSIAGLFAKMDLRSRYLLCLFITVAMGSVQAQYISSSVGTSTLVCIGQQVNYSFYNLGSSPLTNICSYNWSLKGSGDVIGNNGSTHDPYISVAWHDQDPNKVEVELIIYTGTTCSGTTTSHSYSYTNILRSVYRQEISAPTSVNVPFCSTSAVNISTAHMYVESQGEVIPQTEVDAYEWTVPAGWRVVSTHDTGIVDTAIPAISIEPLATNSGPCSAGTLSVRGIIQCAGYLPSYSDMTDITINRTPILAITTSPSNYAASYGNLGAVTFSVPSYSCATNYQWSFPAGWTGSTSGSSVTVTPNGCSNTSGQASVTVTFPGTTSTCTVTTSYGILFSSPTMPVSGPAAVCYPGGSFSLDNSPSSMSASWSVSPANLFSSSSGPGKTPYLSLADPSSAGLATVTITPACATPISKTFWAGVPLYPLVSGPQVVDYGSEYYYEAVPFTGSDPSFAAQGVTDYEWSFPLYPSNAGWYCGNCTNNATWISPGPGSSWVSLRTHNGCGYSDRKDYEVFVQGGGGGGDCPPGGCEEPFSVYPNPSSDALIISLDPSRKSYKLDPLAGQMSPAVQKFEKSGQHVNEFYHHQIGQTQQFESLGAVPISAEVKLIDGQGNHVFVGTADKLMNKVPVHHLQSGLFFLVVKINGTTYTKHILVNH